MLVPFPQKKPVPLKKYLVFLLSATTSQQCSHDGIENLRKTNDLTYFSGKASKESPRPFSCYKALYDQGRKPIYELYQLTNTLNQVWIPYSLATKYLLRYINFDGSIWYQI